MTPTEKVANIIAAQVQSVCDWDDRTSPDEYPDHLLITADELKMLFENITDAALSAAQETIMNRPQLEELRDRLAMMPMVDRGIRWELRDRNGAEHLEVWGEIANAFKYILDNPAAIVSALSAALAVEAGTDEYRRGVRDGIGEALQIACDQAALMGDLALEGVPENARNREAMEAVLMRFSTTLRHTLSGLTTSPASSGVEGEAVAYFTPYYENDRTGKLVPVIVSAESVTEPRGDWTPLYRLPASPSPAPEAEPVGFIYEWKPRSINNDWQVDISLKDPRPIGVREYRNVSPVYRTTPTPAVDADAVIEAIAAERERQTAVEGWTAAHDDAHTDFSLAKAACIYAVGATLDGPDRAVMDTHGASGTPGWMKDLWPWDIKWWKPTSRRRDLIKAAALIIAEIERLDRALSLPPSADKGE